VPALGHRPWETRFWCFYETRQDLHACVVPFLSAGLQHRERCLCFAADSAIAELQPSLRHTATHLDEHPSANAVTWFSLTSDHLLDTDSDHDRMTTELARLCDRAQADGYEGLRVVVDWTGVQNLTRSALLAREQALVRALAGRPILILCTYPLTGTAATAVFETARAHAIVVAHRHNAWAILTAPELHQARLGLHTLLERLERRAAVEVLPTEPGDPVLGHLLAEHERAETVLQEHIWFLESLDHINRAMQGAENVEQLMRDVLDTLLEVLKCDRSWMVYPCDPDSPTWMVPMERTRPEYPGVLPMGVPLPLDPNGAEVFRLTLATDGPLMFGPGTERPVPPEAENGFGIKSFLVQALYPRIGKPWSFGLHQCSHARQWTPLEARLLKEIGRRMADSLTTLLTIRDLRASETELAQAQQLAHIGHWEHDLETNRMVGSEETQRIIGLPEPTGGIDFVAFLEHIHPDDRRRVEECAAQALRGQEAAGVEYRLIRPDGSQRYIFGQWNATLDASGKLRRLFGTLQDITERRRAEEDLRTLSHAVEQSPVSIIITDTTGKIEYVNPKFTQVSGYSREEAAGHNPRLLKSDETSPEEYRQLWATILQGGTWRGEFHNRKKDGTLYWESASISPVLDESGRVAHFVAVKEDITERKKSEEALAHRLAELEAVAEISSELRKAQSRSEMMAVILGTLAELLKADGAAFAMRDATSYETVVESAIGRFTPAIDRRFATGEGISGQVILTGELYLNNAAVDAPELALAQLPRSISAVVCAPLIAQEERIGALWVGRTDAFSEHDAKLIAAVADMAASAIKRATLTEQSQRDAHNLAQAYEQTIEGWSRALDLRDRETEGHSLRVTDMTLRLAKAAGLPEEDIAHVRRGALLHDIGKMGVPDSILLKPGPLTADELAIMRQHPLHAYNMLAPIAYLRPALEIPFSHHEKWDGTGYPNGLQGDQIPFSARLFAVVDVWDALTSDRPYRSAWSAERSLAYIREQRSRHFDPLAVDLFFRVFGSTISQAG